MSKLKKTCDSEAWHLWRAGEEREEEEVNKKGKELIRTEGVDSINKDDSRTVATEKTSSLLQ